MPIVKNVSARIHHLSIMHDDRPQTVSLVPGQSLEISDEAHARLMSSGAGQAGELVDWDRPMPKPEGMSLSALDDEKSIAAIEACKNPEILLAWAKREPRTNVQAAIDARLKSLAKPDAYPPPPPPPHKHKK